MLDEHAEIVQEIGRAGSREGLQEDQRDHWRTHLPPPFPNQSNHFSNINVQRLKACHWKYLIPFISWNHVFLYVVVIQIALGFFFKTRLGKGEEVRQYMECSKKKQYNYRYHLLVSGRATAITHRQLHIVFQTVVARRQETVIISLPWWPISPQWQFIGLEQLNLQNWSLFYSLWFWNLIQ